MVFLLCLRSASTDRLQWLQPCSRVAGKCYVGSYLVHMHMLPAEVSVYEAEVGARQYALPCMCPVGSLEFQSSSVHRC